jgi:hypothetical protein
VHRDRLKEIRAELAEMLDEFKQTGANQAVALALSLGSWKGEQRDQAS